MIPMSTEQGPPAPLSARALSLATLLALVLAVLALTVYILPASYGLDPVGAGAAFGFQGQPPDEAAAPLPEAPDVRLPDVRLHTYEASWPATGEEGPGAEGYTAENETTTVELALPRANVTEATVALRWTDDNETAGQESEPDELELVLEAPDGTRSEPARAEGGSEAATVEISMPLYEPPADRTLTAFDAGQARRSALAQAPAREAPGPWRAHVTVVEAGDVADAGLPSADGSPGEDQGTEWQLGSRASAYELSLEEGGPADVRQDTHTFRLAPGEGMEHKVTLDAEDPLVYAWRATGEVYQDFHGEPADGDGFTSHASGTREAANGTFVAPFGGTHGWYWENRGEEPVAITLATRGDYDDAFTS